MVHHHNTNLDSSMHLKSAQLLPSDPLAMPEAAMPKATQYIYIYLHMYMYTVSICMFIYI